jgi:hypothetical protein
LEMITATQKGDSSCIEMFLFSSIYPRINFQVTQKPVAWIYENVPSVLTNVSDFDSGSYQCLRKCFVGSSSA